MKRLVLKLAVLFLPLVALIAAVAYHVQTSPEIRARVYSPDLEGKLQALLTPGTEVVIGGDSRAERQMVPAVMQSILGKPAVNVATTACDLVSLCGALQRRPLPPSAKILVLSASVFQVNDGATDRGYLSRAAVLRMTLPEKIAVHRDATAALFSDMVEVSLLKEPAPLAVDPAVLAARGFHGVNGTLDLPPRITLDPATTNHAWYRKVDLHGARWRLFREALACLAATGRRIYLVDPPVSPAWRSYTAGTFIDRTEREFAAMVAQEAGKYPNVRFLDYYTRGDLPLQNGDFYDIQHLNPGGAAKFTAILSEEILSDIRGRSAYGADTAKETSSALQSF